MSAERAPAPERQGMRPLRVTMIALAVAALALFAARFAVQESHASRARPAPARPEAAPETDRAGRTAAEMKAISRAVRKGVRAAEDDDADDSESRKELQEVYVDYHPYFVRGDVDGDGRLDFAQAYTYTVGGEARFDVAVFFGNADGSFNGPVFVERGLKLAPGDLAIERTILIVTPNLAQDDTHRWRYERSDDRFHDADEGTSDDDTPDEGPDERPRARI